MADPDRTTSELTAALARAYCVGLGLAPIGRLRALAPSGSTEPLRRVATACIRDLDGFCTPASEAEHARHRKIDLSPRQEEQLMQWGYTYVMEEFRFHLTLSGRLPEEVLSHWAETLHRSPPDLPMPFEMGQIALCSEPEDGRLELIHRYALAG